jgi:hypothetical protein
MKELREQKFVKLFNRCILSWQETHDCLLLEGCSEERIIELIGKTDQLGLPVH